MRGCKELTAKRFPTEVGLVKQIDRIYYEVLKKTGEIKPQKRVQQANFALAVRGYRALHTAMDALENGYYEIAMTLLRSVYENYVQMDYFVTNPEAARQWIEEDKEFEQGDMRKKLGLSGDFYKLLSRNYAHPLKVTSIKPLILEVTDDGKMSLNIYPVFSDTECYTSLFLWIFFANKIIVQVQRVFVAKDIPDKKWMQRVVDVQKLVEQYIEEEKYLQKKAGTEK